MRASEGVVQSVPIQLSVMIVLSSVHFYVLALDGSYCAMLYFGNVFDVLKVERNSGIDPFSLVLIQSVTNVGITCCF